MSDIERALAAVLDGSPPDTFDEERLRRTVAELVDIDCGGISDKLNEFRAARRSGRLGALLAELRIAHAISRHLSCTIDFQVGDAADIRFDIDGVDCLLEVVHKSSPHPWSAVFHPDPADLDRYASGCDWQRAAHRLHTTLARLPISIQPWLAAEFLEQRVTGRERANQESACGEVANWLATHLEAAFGDGRTELRYDGVTRFELSVIDAAPGFVKGHASLEAWFAIEGAQRQSIEAKNSKASERLLASGADCYFVGLAVDEAIASRGDDLLSTLLGPLVYSDTKRGTFRPVAAVRRARIDDARRRGRGDLLDLAELDPDENNLCGWPEGVYLAPTSADLSGVLALYYTDALQFVPNPFSTNDIDRVRRRFPAQLTPFSPRAL